MNNKFKQKNEAIFYVRGMHCASCELNIERKLLEKENIKSVEASLNKGEVIVEYENAAPQTNELTSLFSKEGYVFSNSPIKNGTKFSTKDFATILIVFILAGLGYIFINKLGLSSLINVSEKSSLPAFLFFGVLAGTSTCAALVGGIILSTAKQWPGRQPHILFNLGRILSYGFFGALLGFAGNKLQLSLSFYSFLILAVSLIMIFLAFDMLGINAFRKFQITMPKFITRRVANANRKKQTPFLMGAATFFLPCGFTLTAQSAALLSASPIQGGLIMLFFSLGTAPILLLIGLTSAKFLDNPRWSSRFLKTAGALVLFFAIFNINSQLNVFGVSSLSDIKIAAPSARNDNNLKIAAPLARNDNENNLPPIINGKQIVKMTASSSGYNPNKIKVKAGIPIRWEIEDIGTSGCTNAIISRSLFEGRISLTPGKTSVKEFTIQKPGTYKFTCWMGMASGVFEAI